MVQTGPEDAKNGLSELFTTHPASAFGLLREQLADLPSNWDSTDAETEFLEQFEALSE